MCWGLYASLQSTFWNSDSYRSGRSERTRVPVRRERDLRTCSLPWVQWKGQLKTHSRIEVIPDIYSAGHLILDCEKINFYCMSHQLVLFCCGVSDHDGACSTDCPRSPQMVTALAPCGDPASFASFFLKLAWVFNFLHCE